MFTKGNANFLYRNGMMDVTAHSLDAAHSYKVFKFKNILKEAIRTTEAMEQQFEQELSIDPVFWSKLNELQNAEKLSKKEKEDLEALEQTAATYNDLVNAMLAEEFPVPEAKSMPYEEWKKLQDENKNLLVTYQNSQGQIIAQKELLVLCEDILENILWKAPEE